MTEPTDPIDHSAPWNAAFTRLNAAAAFQSDPEAFTDAVWERQAFLLPGRHPGRDHAEELNLRAKFLERAKFVFAAPKNEPDTRPWPFPHYPDARHTRAHALDQAITDILFTQLTTDITLH